MIYHSAELDDETGLYLRQQRIYIAGKPAIRIPQIRQMYDDIENMGHHITYRWADVEVEVKKPYRENLKYNRATATNMLLGSAMADVFIFFQDENIHGALEERGAFSFQNSNTDGKKLYLVEDSMERQSIFDSLECVEIVKDTEKIYKDLGRVASLANPNYNTLT